MSISAWRWHEHTLYIPDSPETALVAMLRVEPGQGTRDEQLRRFGLAVLSKPLFPFRSFPTGVIITKPVAETDKERNRLHCVHALLSRWVSVEDIPSPTAVTAFTKDPDHYLVTDLHRNALQFIPLQAATEAQ